MSILGHIGFTPLSQTVLSCIAIKPQLAKGGAIHIRCAGNEVSTESHRQSTEASVSDGNRPCLVSAKVEEVLPVMRGQLRDRNGNLYNHP